MSPGNPNDKLKATLWESPELFPSVGMHPAGRLPTENSCLKGADNIRGTKPRPSSTLSFPLPEKQPFWTWPRLLSPLKLRNTIVPSEPVRPRGEICGTFVWQGLGRVTESEKYFAPSAYLNWQRPGLTPQLRPRLAAIQGHQCFA